MRGKTVLIAVATALALAFLWRLLAPPAPEVVAVGCLLYTSPSPRD